MNEGQLYDAAERELDLYRAVLDRITAERDEAREQVRLARPDRDQLRKAVLDLAAKWGDLAVRCDEAAALDGLPKASVLEQATFAHQLRECAAALRKTAEPPA